MKKGNTDRIEQELMEAFTYEKSCAEIGMPDIETELRHIRLVAGKNKRNRMLRRAACAAACAVLIAGISFATHQDSDICVAYVGGQCITDERKVMEMLNDDMDKISSCDNILEDQLNDFFKE